MALGCVQDTQYSCADAVPCPSKATPSHEPATTSGLPNLAVMCALLLTSGRKAPKMRHFLDEIASLRHTAPTRPPEGALIVKPPLGQGLFGIPQHDRHLALAGKAALRCHRQPLALAPRQGRVRRGQLAAESDASCGEFRAAGLLLPRQLRGKWRLAY